MSWYDCLDVIWAQGPTAWEWANIVWPIVFRKKVEPKKDQSKTKVSIDEEREGFELFGFPIFNKVKSKKKSREES